MTTLSKLEAPSLYPGSESYKKIELARWLSDWHLIIFFQTTQLFSQVCTFFLRYIIFSFETDCFFRLVKDDIKLMMHTVSSPNLLEDAKNIDPVLATDSWQTLMTFTRESSRESFFIIFHVRSMI